MTGPTLKDPEREAALDRDGFVLLPGLAVADLDFLRSMSERMPPPPEPELAIAAATAAASSVAWDHRMAPGEGWRIGSDDSQADDRRRVHRDMAPFWERIAADVLVDHRVVFTSFLTKLPGDASVLPLHQDPSFVDERHHRAITMWVAVDDITAAEGNGALHVLAGSHRVGLELRGTRTEPTYIEHQHRLWPFALGVDARAGDVLVMDTRLLHGSPPNRSPRPRNALAGVLVPRGAELLHAVGVEGDRVEILRVDEDFYAHTSPRSLREHIPEGYEVVEIIPRTTDPTTADALVAQQRRRLPWHRRLFRRA